MVGCDEGDIVGADDGCPVGEVGADVGCPVGVVGDCVG